MMWKCCRRLNVGAVMKNAYEGMEKYAAYVTEQDNNHDGSGGNYREIYFKTNRRTKAPGILNAGSFCNGDDVFRLISFY